MKIFYAIILVANYTIGMLSMIKAGFHLRAGETEAIAYFACGLASTAMAIWLQSELPNTGTPPNRAHCNGTGTGVQ